MTYSQIRKKAEYAERMVNKNWNDAPLKAVKYQKIAARLRNALWSFPSLNIERSYKALEKGRGQIQRSKLLLK